jgi:membrane protease YdiL (CAAX protease family)
MPDNRKQYAAFGGLLMLDLLLAFLAYVAFPLDQLSGGQPMSPSMASIPAWLLGLANAAIILVVYGLLGLAGLWFALKLGLPGIFRKGAGWRALLLLPMAAGLGLGVLIILLDRLSALIGSWSGFTHPPFPLSVVASATAGLGEEILFRLFVLGLWAFLLNLVLRRWKATGIALWVANIIAALAFAASHLPAAMLLIGVTNPAQVPPVVLVELFLINGIVGLAAGAFYMRNGLVAASGVHFWADFMWHVLFPLWHLFLP